MSLSRDQARELAALLHTVREGVSTAAEAARLNELVVQSDEARRLYVEHAYLAAALRWSLGGVDPVESENVGASDSVPVGALLDRPARSTILGFLADIVAHVPGGEFVVGGLVLLAVSGAVWGVIHFTRGYRPEIEQRMLATRSADAGIGSLATDDRARWAKESFAAPDAAVRVGQRYELTAGCAKIHLFRGTTVAIEGPATWQLDSEQRLQFECGKLLAQVPKAGVGFTVVTSTAEVIDLGTEFGVDVDSHGTTELHVIRGRVELKSTTATAPVRKQELAAGQAVRVSAGGAAAEPIPLDVDRFAAPRTARTHVLPGVARSIEASTAEQSIWLGNLFDDFAFTGVSLSSAIKKDEFRAIATVDSLGVDRVVYAGSPVKEVAPGVRFDATSLGWEDLTFAEAPVTNDAWYAGTLHSDQSGARGGIRTRGLPMGHNEPRIEEGIGMHANALITFDLDEIRAAGGIEGHAFEFRSDRAGINDSCIGYRPDKPASVHMAVIVCTNDRVRQVFVDGQSKEIFQRDGVWRVTQAIGEPLRAGGPFAKFRVALPADAKWLTLLSASAGDGHFADAAVWSGARLEVVR